MNNNEKQPLVQVQDVCKYFHVGKNADLKAVDHVSFDIYKGETVGLVGESGCGEGRDYGNNNSCIWIILLLLCCCGNGFGGHGNCGCGNDSCLIILILLFCCGNNGICGGNDGCGCC